MKTNVRQLSVAKTEICEEPRFNALRHGLLSRFTVLPWEDEAEYEGVLKALVARHSPSGPTEEHLVEELAGILWRKRRLRLAEAALYRTELHETLTTEWRERRVVPRALAHLSPKAEPIEFAADALGATRADTETDLKDLNADRRQSDAALKILESNGTNAYREALSALRDDTRSWWAETLSMEDGETEPPYSADAASLRRFLSTEVSDWYDSRQIELENRPAIRAQLYGEALDIDNLEKLARYEVHLDRKLERTLTVLLRLQELQRKGGPS
jgi:hypothetical protein